MRKKRDAINKPSYKPEYIALYCAIRRCHNTKDRSYPKYGGRGICVCSGWKDEWQSGKSFESFLKILGHRPSKHHTLDRIKNNKHYSCGKCDECVKEKWDLNCRWATYRVQNNNSRQTRILVHDGVSLSVRAWARRKGVKFTMLYSRLARGWSIHDTLTKPPRCAKGFYSGKKNHRPMESGYPDS